MRPWSNMPMSSMGTNTAAGRSNSTTTGTVAHVTTRRQIAARYPEGSDVEVHYDPANPSNAALERPAGTAWYLLVIALVCFGVALYASGLLR